MTDEGIVKFALAASTGCERFAVGRCARGASAVETRHTSNARAINPRKAKTAITFFPREFGSHRSPGMGHTVGSVLVVPRAGRTAVELLPGTSASERAPCISAAFRYLEDGSLFVARSTI